MASELGLPSSQPGRIFREASRLPRNKSSGGRLAVSGLCLAWAGPARRTPASATPVFGVLPANGFQRAKAVCHVDLFVSDLVKVAHAITAEQLENLMRPRGAGQPGHGRVRRGFVPFVHGLDEGPPGLVAGRHRRFIHRSQPPAALAEVRSLGTLELVGRPKQRQPAVGLPARPGWRGAPN